MFCCRWEGPNVVSHIFLSDIKPRQNWQNWKKKKLHQNHLGFRRLEMLDIFWIHYKNSNDIFKDVQTLKKVFFLMDYEKKAVAVNAFIMRIFFCIFCLVLWETDYFSWCVYAASEAPGLLLHLSQLLKLFPSSSSSLL